MCTAATYQTKDFYFGRTLDYEFSYGDEIVVTPRRFPLDFCHMGKCDAHYGMIGMAHVADGYPLYYDAVNEKGVGMAGLNFVGNAVYQKVEEGRENVAQYELIPWVLGQCANLQEVRRMLAKMNLVGTPLGSVDQQRGCCEVAEGKYEITIYTSCCNASKGIYYYTTYDNHQISAVDMHRTDLDSKTLSCYKPVTEEQIFCQN